MTMFMEWVARLIILRGLVPMFLQNMDYQFRVQNMTHELAKYDEKSFWLKICENSEKHLCGNYFKLAG